MGRLLVWVINQSFGQTGILTWWWYKIKHDCTKFCGHVQYFTSIESHRDISAKINVGAWALSENRYIIRLHSLGNNFVQKHKFDVYIFFMQIWSAGGQEIAKVSSIHPLGIKNGYTQPRSLPSNRGWDISVWMKVEDKQTRTKPLAWGKRHHLMDYDASPNLWAAATKDIKSTREWIWYYLIILNSHIFLL